MSWYPLSLPRNIMIVVWVVGAVCEGLNLEANTSLWVDCTPAGGVACELPDASVRTHVGLILLLFGASAMGFEPGVGRREGASFLELVSGHEVRIFHSVVSTEATGHIKQHGERAKDTNVRIPIINASQSETFCNVARALKKSSEEDLTKIDKMGSRES